MSSYLDGCHPPPKVLEKCTDSEKIKKRFNFHGPCHLYAFNCEDVVAVNISVDGNVHAFGEIGGSTQSSFKTDICGDFFID